jgi:hypothetical protein
MDATLLLMGRSALPVCFNGLPILGGSICGQSSGQRLRRDRALQLGDQQGAGRQHLGAMRPLRALRQ